LWQAALQQFDLSPLVGTGSGTYDYLGRHFRSVTVQNDPVHVHEDYLELLAEYGVVGAALMAIFLGAHLYAGFQGIRRIVRARLKPSGRRCSNELALLVGILAALFALAAHSLMDFNLHIPANTLVVAFFFGILANPTEALGREEAEPAPTPAWLRFSPSLLGLALAVAAGPLIPGEYFGERARMALRDLELPKTVDFAQRALQFEKRNPDVYFYLGEAKGLLGLGAKVPAERRTLQESAVAAYREGLKLFPRDLRSRLRLGWTLDLMKRFDEADVPLRAALEDDPNFGNVYAYYGFHMEHQHRWKKAEAFYHKAQDLQETEISTAGLKELEHDRKMQAENYVLPFVLPSDDDSDDDTPTPPPPGGP
jgi:tetratricopeptide (TPR) repeat protein